MRYWKRGLVHLEPNLFGKAGYELVTCYAKALWIKQRKKRDREIEREKERK
jgi:hypothetical protein